MKHTPGPWDADTAGWPLIVNSGKDGDPASIVAIVHAADEPNSHYFPVRRHQHQSTVAEANVRLIAAAPELLDCLRKYIEWGETVPYGAPQDVLSAACAAVKKATGEPE